MRKLGPLLALVIALVLAMAAPAGASRATEQSGRGMNRQGGPSTHPGKGWKDPGQDQGSPANDADPDCTGNRTHSPQLTNTGACDDAAGSPDEPGGTGGFDADKDWNNGCGNDTDFEDDNNGQCRGPHQPSPTEPTPDTPHPPKNPQPGGQGPDSTPTASPPTPTPIARPETSEPPVGIIPPAVIVVPGPAPVSSEPPTELPFTGPAHAPDLTAIGLSLITVGVLLVRYERRRV